MLSQRLIGYRHTLGSDRLIVELARNNTLGAQLLGAIEVDLGLRQLRAGQTGSGLSRVELSVELVNCLARAFNLRLRLIDPDLVIARVKGQKHVAAFNPPVFLAEEVSNRAGNPRGDQRYGTVNVSVA